jgi:hypothetical protein
LKATLPRKPLADGLCQAEYGLDCLDSEALISRGLGALRAFTRDIVYSATVKHNDGRLQEQMIALVRKGSAENVELVVYGTLTLASV